MGSELTYKDYVNDADHMDQYRAYQQRYATRIRESDKILLDLVGARRVQGRPTRVLDLGCSTGNFLLHLKRMAPDLALVGADVVTSIIAGNRHNPELDGIEFREFDMLAIEPTPEFDIVVTNAALMFFTVEEFERALVNIGRMLAPGGHLVTFDLFHPFDQSIAVVETSKHHPRGLKFHFRGHDSVRRALAQAGLHDAQFKMFSMPFDLPRSQDPSDITSYTVHTTEDERLSFRGGLYQPWCHVTAQKR